MATFYWTIQLDSITPPSALEVKLGQDGNGSALPASQLGQITDTGQASPLDGAVSTPLLDAMDYLVSWVWDDGAGDLRGPVSAPFTTLTAVLTATRDETFALLDAQTVRGTFVVARAESVALSHSQDATVTTGPIVHTVARAESVALSDSQTGVIAGGSPNPPWENVVLLLHADGTNGGTTFVDSSQYNWPVTANNGAVTSNTNPKFGTAALPLPGYLTVPDDPVFDFGAGDLTIEFWAYNPLGSVYGPLIGSLTVGGINWFISILGDGNLGVQWPSGGNNNSGTPFPDNAYTYVVMTRSSGTWAIWLNTLLAISSSANPSIPFDINGDIFVGRDATNTGPTSGEIDEVRITKGIALYSLASPPVVVPTSPFPNGPLLPTEVARAESVALSDSQNAVVISGAASIVQESVALNHTQNAAAIYGRNRAESVALTDQTSVQSVAYKVARAESIALTATQTAATQTVYTGTVNESFSLNTECNAYIGALPLSRIGHFGEPPRWGAKEAERAMIQLEDEFILEIVLSLAVKGAIA